MAMLERLDQRGGCLLAILRLFSVRTGRAEATSDEMPYRMRDDFLSPAERSFLGVLQQAVGDSAVICPKVRLADLLFVVDWQQNRAAANRIDRKHVDFVLCDPDRLQPQCAIELDDKSHQRANRQERDEFVERALAAAGLPLVRVKAQAHYNVRALADELRPHLKSADRQPSSVAAPGQPPMCPKCGAPMVLRTSGRGTAAGESFYGCSNFPKCRSTVPLAK
jgi:very-short-patch-repair endonuclease